MEKKKCFLKPKTKKKRKRGDGEMGGVQVDTRREDGSLDSGKDRDGDGKKLRWWSASVQYQRLIGA